MESSWVNGGAWRSALWRNLGASPDPLARHWQGFDPFFWQIFITRIQTPKKMTIISKHLSKKKRKKERKKEKKKERRRRRRRRNGERDAERKQPERKIIKWGGVCVCYVGVSTDVLVTVLR